MRHIGQPWLTLLTKNQKNESQLSFWDLISFTMWGKILRDTLLAVTPSELN